MIIWSLHCIILKDGDDDDEDEEVESDESPPPSGPVDRNPNSRGCNVEFKAGQSLTHQFDDSNLWAHGKYVYVCWSMYVTVRCVSYGNTHAKCIESCSVVLSVGLL